jgi:hypothetical protein
MATGETSEQAVRIGERMRFSTELLRDIHDQPNHATRVVYLKEIRREDDGCVVLVVERAD